MPTVVVHIIGADHFDVAGKIFDHIIEKIVWPDDLRA